MHGNFEYEERYAVFDPAKTCQALEDFGFKMMSTEKQIDHWFIPRTIMSPAEQAQWFDYGKGYALRLRDQVRDDQRQVLITSKQLLRPADHSGMINNEAVLTTSGIRKALTPMGSEFGAIIKELENFDDEKSFTLDEAKHLIERAGRKDYIVINKLRSTFHHAELTDVIADLDVVPALANTSLGFSASIELEYIGPGTIDEAKAAVTAISSRLGFRTADMLAMALPGLAIKYLAKF